MVGEGEEGENKRGGGRKALRGGRYNVENNSKTSLMKGKLTRIEKT